MVLFVRTFFRNYIKENSVVFITLLVAFYYFLKDRKINYQVVAIFVVWFVGALINAVAPGNYVRHGAIDSTGLHPISALFDAMGMTNTRYQWLFDNTNITVIVIILFVCGIYTGTKFSIRIKEYFVISILALLMPVVTSFPVALGYSSGELMENRCAFLIDFAIIMTVVNFFVALGVLVASKIEVKNAKKMMLIFGVLVVFACAMDTYGLDNVTVLNVSQDLRNGVYSDYYDTVGAFYNRLDAYERGSDVRILASEAPGYIANFYNFLLTGDPANFINSSMAQYYGLNSLVLYVE